MPTYTIAPYEQRQYFDDNGNPVAGGFVYAYLAGTSTPATTYADSAGTPNANPIPLDSAGRCRMYLDIIAYKFIVKDLNLVPVGLTMDQVFGVPTSGLFGGIPLSVFAFGGQNTAPITATGYGSALHPGTGLFSADSAHLPGVYALQATGQIDISGTLNIAIVDLSSGSPNTPLAVVPITSQTVTVNTSGAITFGAPGIDRLYGIKTIVTANTGFAWAATLMRFS